MNRRLYITLNGKLSRRASTVRFERKDDGKVIFIPVEQLEEIYILADVDFNRKLMSFLGGKGVAVHFFSFSGAYVGTFLPRKGSGDSEILVREVQIYMDWGERMKFARAFVDGAIRNMILLLKGRDILDVVDRLEEARGRIKTIFSYNRLLLEEARAWEIYYSSWNRMIKAEGFRMTARTRKPPADPINAMISFGNALLYAFVLNELYRTGLDPRIGYLHSVKKRRFGLNLDMAEIFRPLVVDRLILKLINRRQVSREDFVRSGRGVYLGRRGKRVMVEGFEKQLRSRIKMGSKYARMTYYGLIKRECQRLKKAIVEGTAYEPLNLEE